MKASIRKICVKNEEGQLSIFLGIALIIVISMLAFIVNVGLFVKAKINLQNAVDAAAWSGAATQSRQLTQIGYLNWELRNNYKEWMFKYYVLGNLFVYREMQAGERGGDKSDFRVKAKGLTKSFDPYNIPSICMHFGNENNDICQILKVPGIPRFDKNGPDLVNISAEQTAFIQSFIEAKAGNCSKRSQMNFNVALMWSYGTGRGAEIPDLPQVSADRMGAWPAALELAMRIRNWEFVVNRPAVDEGICAGDSGSVPGCGISESDLAQGTGDLPHNERPYKAFWSAYRNLGGGKTKGGSNSSGGDIHRNFVLSEIAPTPFTAEEDSLSGLLIPQEITHSNGTSVFQKQYLDLELNLINYAIFYTTITAAGGELGDTIENTTVVTDNVETSADCKAIKTALPVPSYIMGLTKNPNVLTYYTVHGRTRFVGMFNPFKLGEEAEGIEIQAYATAKPFGGKIGPRLFKTDSKTIYARENTTKNSAPFISGLVQPSSPASEYAPGTPIPASPEFWISGGGSVIGGDLEGAEIEFGVPNMIYDAFQGMKPIQADAAANFESLDDYSSENESPRETKGLYSRRQLVELQKSLPSIGAGVYTVNDINDAISAARAPTLWDAANYLIPIKETEEGFDAIPNIFQEDDSNSFSLYAPLFGEGTLYQTGAALKLKLDEQLNKAEKAFVSYMKALHEVSQQIKNSGPASERDVYLGAANSIYPSNASAPSTVPDVANAVANDLNDCSSGLSLAAKYYQFFLQTNENPRCGIVPLRAQISELYSEISDERRRYHNSTYQMKNLPGGNDKIKNTNLLTAYFPGQAQTGGSAQGLFLSPLVSGEEKKIRRNSYSTKFIPTHMVMHTTFPYTPKKGVYQEFIFSEGYGLTELTDINAQDGPIANMLSSDNILSSFESLGTDNLKLAH